MRFAHVLHMSCWLELVVAWAFCPKLQALTSLTGTPSAAWHTFRFFFWVAQWYPFPFFGSGFPYRITNPKKGDLIRIWLLGYQVLLKNRESVMEFLMGGRRYLRNLREA